MQKSALSLIPPTPVGKGCIATMLVPGKRRPTAMAATMTTTAAMRLAMRKVTETLAIEYGYDIDADENDDEEKGCEER